MNPTADKPLRAFRLRWGRWLRRSLVCLGTLAALVWIFYAEVDRRGQRDWNQYRQAKEAGGEHLEFQAYIPKAVPDEQNFAAAPIVKSWIQTDGGGILTNDLYARAADNISETKNAKDKGHRHFVDLVAWRMASDALQAGKLERKQEFGTDRMELSARAEAAPAVLEGMKSDEADFEELRLASGRPYARFPIEYDMEDLAQIPLRHLAIFKRVCERLNLQACAELAAGQPDKALADVKLMLYLADAIKHEPFLISYLVRAACFQIAVQPVWEGLAEHRWTESQLQELQARFQHYEFLADLDQSLKEERTFGIREVDQIKKRGLGTVYDLFDIERGDFDGFGGTTWHKEFLNSLGRILPAGWYDQERLKYCIFFDAQTKGVLDLAGERVLPSQIASNYAELTRQLPDPSLPPSVKSILHHQVIAANILGFLRSIPVKAAAPQTAANQAAIACALERYRLASGQFPETLEALTPQFMSRLPDDVMTGQPYKYRRTEDGQFVLYSVGWNEKDDGGTPGKHGLFDDQEGDWVWAYPVK